MEVRLAASPEDSCLGPEVRAREGLHFHSRDGFTEAEPSRNRLPGKPA